MTALSYKHADGIATVTLNNPPQNRLSSEVFASLAEAMTDISNRDDTRVVCIKAEGPDFSWGGDIMPWLEHTPATSEVAVREALKSLNMLEDLPVPVVAAVQGHCLGGGFELALRADIILASEDARFGHPETTIGVFTLTGGIQRVAERVGRTRAMQWATTAEHVTAKDAHQMALINEVVPAGGLQEALAGWAKRLAAGPTLAHADHKRLLRVWADRGVRAADELMPAMTSRTLFSDDAQGSLRGAIEAAMASKPQPNYEFKGR